MQQGYNHNDTYCVYDSIELFMFFIIFTHTHTHIYIYIYYVIYFYILANWFNQHSITCSLKFEGINMMDYHNIHLKDFKCSHKFTFKVVETSFHQIGNKCAFFLTLWNFILWNTKRIRDELRIWR